MDNRAQMRRPGTAKCWGRSFSISRAWIRSICFHGLRTARDRKTSGARQRRAGCIEQRSRRADAALRAASARAVHHELAANDSTSRPSSGVDARASKQLARPPRIFRAPRESGPSRRFFVRLHCLRWRSRQRALLERLPKANADRGAPGGGRAAGHSNRVALRASGRRLGRSFR